MRAFFDPRSVLLVGVPRATGVGAYNGLEMLLRYGYRGKIFVVHPEATEILGHPVHRRVADLPEVPELAVISLGRDRVLPAVKECLDRGLKRFVVISQGFGDADERGRELQAELVAQVRAAGARLVGPNTMGSLNSFVGFTTAFVDLSRPAHPPPLTLVAQSGAPQVGSESFTGPLGQALDLGNAADVSFAEVLEYLEGDPLTRVIALHMEGLPEGRRFLQVASRVGRKKPIVVLKTGRSAAGARAALSHTGSLVGEDQVFSAAFARAGVLRARDTTDFKDTLRALVKLPPLQGPRLGIATPSGALGIIALDALEAAGLEAGPLPEAVRRAVEPLGPYWHRLGNPVDLWPIGMKTGDYLLAAKETVQGFLAADEIDGVLCMLPALASPLHANIVRPREFIAELDLPRFGKPLVLCLYGDGRDHVMQELAEVPGVACYVAVERAVRALARLAAWERLRRQPPEEFPLPAAAGAADPRILLGQGALEYLSRQGLPVAPGRLAATPREAVAAARELGFPVVLKAVSPALVHKWEAGAVLLGLTDPEAVEAGWATLWPRAREAAGGQDPQGILVQKQLSGREVLLGIKRDATFGPVVVCGLGGIYTEVLADTAQTLAPVTETQARELLTSLRASALLTGVRGEPGVDLEALARMLAALSRLAVAEPGLAEADLNPVLATPHGCWAVDARLVWRPR
ncbi:MAG: acetate--CoA ligase family protein [Syntrophobacterales bacterium]|nr:acetate--CoA ligase family protein [Syntrophobacterales bacterium]